MKKVVKKIVKRKVSPIPESVNGLKLAQFILQDRSEFQVGRRIWFQFHYDNIAGKDVGYGSTGLAIHRWTGSEWALHAYKHSYGGPQAKIKTAGGPGGGPFHDDNWKADQPGEFALTPYISFDKQAANKIDKLNDPAAVTDVSHMALPLYVTIKDGQQGAAHEDPPAPLFPDRFEEVEVEEVVEVEDGSDDGDAPDQPDDDVTTETPPTEIDAGSAESNEVTRQVIEWPAGSGVAAVRIKLSRREGQKWSVHTVLTQALEADSRIEVIFLDSSEDTA